MRNLKKVLSLALVLMMVLSVVSGAAYIGYSDEDTITAINEDYIVAAKLLNELGVVVGSVNEAGAVVYDGQGAIDRAQLARVLYVLYSGNNEYSKIYNPGEAFMSLACPFTDIDGNWAEGYIKYGYNKGYLNGKDNNKYDPTANVTAAEMATALLAVIGYSKADLAKNWPSNVILYGYEGVSGNLFTTGLSVQNQDPTILATDGWHVLGMDELVETEDELSIDEELTREQAFYMMYRAINNRYVKGTGYTFVEKVFGEGAGAYYDDEWYKGTVVATPDTALVGNKAKNDVVLWSGAYFDYVDLGYTATQGAASVTGKAKSYGYRIAATDWAAHLGQEIQFREVRINGKKYVTNYMFSYDELGNAKFNGFKGEGITKIDTEKTNVRAIKDNDDAKALGLDPKKSGYNAADYVVIDEKPYTFWTVAGKSTYGLSINGAEAEGESAADFKAAVIEAAGKKTHDAISFTLVDGKIYAASMDELKFGIVKSIKNKEVKLEGDITAYKFDIENVHIGDGILYYTYEKEIDADKTGKETIIAGRKVTKVWKQIVAVTKSKDADGNDVYTAAYKKDNKDGTVATTMVLGSAFNGSAYATTAEAINDTNLVITNNYNLWVDGGYVFGYKPYDAANHEANYQYDNVRVATFDSIACVKTYDTTDSKYVYNYTVTVKTADGTAYTFTFKKDNSELTDNEKLSYMIHQEVISWEDLKTAGDVNPVHGPLEDGPTPVGPTDAAICQRALAYYVIDNLETGKYEVIREKPSLFKKGAGEKAEAVNVAFELTDEKYNAFAYLMNKANVDKTFTWKVVELVKKDLPQ